MASTVSVFAFEASVEAVAREAADGPTVAPPTADLTRAVSRGRALAFSLSLFDRTTRVVFLVYKIVHISWVAQHARYVMNSQEWKTFLLFLNEECRTMCRFRCLGGNGGFRERYAGCAGRRRKNKDTALQMSRRNDKFGLSQAQTNNVSNLRRAHHVPASRSN